MSNLSLLDTIVGTIPPRWKILSHLQLGRGVVTAGSTLPLHHARGLLGRGLRESKSVFPNTGRCGHVYNHVHRTVAEWLDWKATGDGLYNGKNTGFGFSQTWGEILPRPPAPGWSRPSYLVFLRLGFLRHEIIHTHEGAVKIRSDILKASARGDTQCLKLCCYFNWFQCLIKGWK